MHIANQMTSVIYGAWHHLLTTFEQTWLDPLHLKMFAEAIHNRGAALGNCSGFMDGQLDPHAGLGNARDKYIRRHKKVHAIKFQSIVAPNGLIANLFGPVKGKRHDSAMLLQSQVLPQLQNHSLDTQGNVLCMYGDPAYTVSGQIEGPFRGGMLTQLRMTQYICCNVALIKKINKNKE